MSSNKKCFWLIAGQVVATDAEGQVGARSFNVMLTTPNAYVTRKDIAKAQNGLLQRFMGEVDKPKEMKISDCFIISISPLGLQTDADFQEGFPDSEPVKAPTSQGLN